MGSNRKKSDKIKEAVRITIWNRLKKADIARPPFPIEGRIPNFVGADHAAQRVVQLPMFDQWQLVFCNPDSPQRPVRQKLLQLGKRVVMASPRLRSGFLLLDPEKLSADKMYQASTIRGAFMLGKQIDEPPEPIDAKILGSVAVDSFGGRIGKGGGYSDLEYCILAELGLITEKTPTITTVHDLQIISKKLIMTPQDVPLDIIVTPNRHFHTQTTYLRPTRIEWSLVSPKRREEIAWPTRITLPPKEKKEV